MATTLTPKAQETATSQRVVLHHVRWTTYESLLADHESRRSPRFTYDRGTLEIMSPLPKHEDYNSALRSVVESVLVERDQDFLELGSTTFRREDLERGFEPDSCFYVRNVDQIRGRDRLNLLIDPPPDLVIEIEMTHSSLDKMSIYAQMKVPEVWTYDGTALGILILEGKSYTMSDESRILPSVRATEIAELLNESKTIKRPAWLRRLREWAGSKSTGTVGSN